MPSLNSLINYLNQKNIQVKIDASCAINFDLGFYTDDGNGLSKRLAVIEENEELLVREIEKTYPNFCPNRHINMGGFFCLGLQDELQTSSIEEWIYKVKLFLEAQYKCEKNGEWPIHEFPEWAHGDAAKYQKIVEEYLKKIEKNLFEIKIADLKVQRKISGNKVIYHVLLDEDLILVGLENKILNKRCTCLCEKNGRKKHRTIKDCPRQCAVNVFMIAMNIYLMNEAEKNFWESFNTASNICCRTMKNCQLNRRKE